MPLPEDVTMKLQHATRHLQALNAQVHSFGERDPYDTVTEIHTRSPFEGFAVLRMKVNRDPIREWSLTIGDCAHNLRATLDYAALALWVANSGEPSPEKIEDIMFPIYSTQRKFRVNRRRKIGGLHHEAKRIIRLAQPYQRRDDPDGHPLGALSIINNHDKHRRLHTTHAVTEDAELKVIERERLIVTNLPKPRVGRFEDGDLLASISVLALDHNPVLKVKLSSTYGVAFDEEGPGRGQLAANLLNDIRLYIRDELLAALEPYF